MVDAAERSIAEADVQEILRTPGVFVGSDGSSIAPYGPTGIGKPHPRFYGTYVEGNRWLATNATLRTIIQDAHESDG